MELKVESIKLANGLPIYLCQDPRKHTTFFGLITKFGGAVKDFQLDGKAYHVHEGIAHLLEHYLVESNAHGNYVEILSEMQMETNAQTGSYQTMYYFSGVDKIEEGIDILLKSCYSPIFTEENLNRVKQPIYQEVRMTNDRKFKRFNMYQFDQLFHKISFRDTAGTVESVQDITLDEVKACYHAFYQPQNQMIVIAGNFDKEALLKKVESCYATLAIENHPMQLMPPEEPLTVKEKEGAITLPTDQQYVDLTYKIDLSSFTSKEKVRLTFYLNYFFTMAFGHTSKVYQELVKNKIITRNINTSDFNINPFLILSIGAYTDQKDKFLEAIQKVLKEKKYLNSELFELCRKRTILNLILRNESPEKFIMPFISNIILFDYPFLDTISDAESFTFEEFQDYINRLDLSHYAITVMEKE